MKRFLPVFLVSAFLLLFSPAVSLAGPSALEELLTICEQKGMVTPEKADALRGKIRREEAEKAARECEMRDKLKALILWEKELAARQKALLEWEEGLPVPENEEVVSNPPPVGLFPTEQALEAVDRFPGENNALITTLLEEQATKNPNKVWYRDGLNIGDPSYTYLRIGGLLQADYDYIAHERAQTAENRFDIRRARLILSGRLQKLFNYRFAYEFEGAGSRRLMDAYAGVRLAEPVSVRMGQFKEPYGLEQSGRDRDIWFAERSMGYYLTPGRDVGVMVHGSFWRDRIHYGAGVFNGDGLDDSTGGNVDDPQFTGRLALTPFKNLGWDWADNLQVGGSYAYSRIDRNNVDISIQTAAGTEFFNVASRAKFNIIREADNLTLNAAEFAWAYGPVALSGEYFHVLYSDVQTSKNTFDIDMKDWYASGLVMLTGEEPAIKKGVFAGIAPRRGTTHDGYGAFGLAFRYDRFYSPASAYEDLFEVGESVRKADAWSLALNWWPEAQVRLLVDWTRTTFDEPLKVGRDAVLGTAEYAKEEDVVTGRFQLGF